MTRRTGLWAGVVLAAIGIGGLVYSGVSGAQGGWPWGGRSPEASVPWAGYGGMMREYTGTYGGMMGGYGGRMGPWVGAPTGVGTTTVSPAAVTTAAEQVPAGATVDTRAHTIRFTTTDARLTVVAAALADGQEMSFRIAGLTNPAITVPAGARVTMTVINDSAALPHNWMLTASAPPFTSVPAVVGGASVPVMPARTATGASESSVTFTAPASGTYHYICAVPGHAAAGMYGTFVVA